MLYNLAISIIVESKINTEEEIDKCISELRQLPMFTKKISDEQALEVKASITAERAIKLEQGYLIEGKKHEHWFLSRKANLDMRYWERYKKHLLHEKHFATDVVNTMDDILDILTDLLGDPDRSTGFQRRGLIIGDVQSGKTANYTGLICKAADAGYKVVVLMTGTIEKLRRQTQIRLDEGFVGIDSDAMMNQKDNINIGVGNFDPSIHPMVLTSTRDDFKLKNATNLGFNLKTINGTVLFVIKKNVTVLKRLNKWLCTFNQNGREKIDHSLLVIDDEADNASVNTNPEDRDPTATNYWITEILNNFKRTSYVGFTATPFANIFIDPDSNESLEKENLFPKDYIYSLNAPSNYIGARSIFEEGAAWKNMLQKIDINQIEQSEYIPSKHKQEHIIREVPDDMKKAINAFFLINAIRDFREDVSTTHRSMLINVSRFVSLQRQLGILVNGYVKELQASIRLNWKKSPEDALKDPDIMDLKNTFDDLYSDVNVTWEDILTVLNSATVPIKVFVINQKSNTALNYEEYDKDGLRVIAIGGLSLSRGLTLEGLAISYFYRNSKTYDTLMQMGRWFGYRGGYADLCRIWMSEESIEWYRTISEATDELRKDVKRYEDTDLTPMDFGLRVRSDITALIVTAYNKMRSARMATVNTSLSGEAIETPELFTDKERNNTNLKCIEKFIAEISEKGHTIHTYQRINSTKKVFGFIDICKEDIMGLLSLYQVTLRDTIFDTETLRKFIAQYAGDELNFWDISFVSGESDLPEYKIAPEYSVKRIQRSYSLVSDDKIAKMSGSKRRLGSRTDAFFNLTEHQIREVKTLSQKETPSQKDYFRYIKRKPLLCIYMIELTDCKDQDKVESGVAAKISERFLDQPMVGIGIGIPKLGDLKTKYAKYVINKIQALNMDSESEDIDIGDDE